MMESRRRIDWESKLVDVRRVWMEEASTRQYVCTEAEKLTESRPSDASFGFRGFGIARGGDPWAIPRNSSLLSLGSRSRSWSRSLGSSSSMASSGG